MVFKVFRRGLGGGIDISVRATKNAVQSILNNNWTALNFQTEDYDTDTMHDNAVNNTRITFNTAGKYIIVGYVRFADSAVAGEMGVRFLLNGVTTIQILFSAVDIITAGRRRNSNNLLREYIVGDFLELEAFQKTGVALNADIQCTFTAQKIDRGG